MLSQGRTRVQCDSCALLGETGECNTSRPTITDIISSEHIVHLRAEHDMIFAVPSTMLARFDLCEQLHTRYLIRAFDHSCTG